MSMSHEVVVIVPVGLQALQQLGLQERGILGAVQPGGDADAGEHKPSVLGIGRHVRRDTNPVSSSTSADALTTGSTSIVVATELSSTRRHGWIYNSSFLKNTITIRLFGNMPLQFFVFHKNATEYVWTQPGPSCRRIRRRILHLPCH